MATLVISPDVEEFLDLMDTQSSDNFSITEIKSEITILLDELKTWKLTGATILGIKISNGEYAINQVPETVVQAVNQLIILGSKDQLNKIRGIIC